MMNVKSSLSLLTNLAFISGSLFCKISFAQSPDEGLEKLEEVVVTGSRIARSSLDSVTPLQVLSSEDINLSAETNIGEYLNQLPSVGQPLFNRSNSNFDINNSGVVTIDFRDLGIERTLTLVNGRRFVAGVPGSSAVDLNAIPTAMIERVEVTTGGASAIYGSDAVAGVINFILKDDFEGVELGTRYEISDEDDGEEYDVSLLIGSNFSDDRGNATVFFGYTDQGAVYSRDRSRSAIDAISASSLNSDGEPLRQIRPFFSSVPLQGRFDVGNGDAGNFTFLRDGTLVNSFDTNGDRRAPDGFNRSAFRTIAIPTERFLTSTNIHYTITDQLTVFFEGTYSAVDTKSELEPFPLDSADIFLDNQSGGIPLQYANSGGNLISNPFMPIEILDAANANIGTDREVDSIRFRRRLAEFGPRSAINDRQTFRFSTGLKGATSFDWNWDVSYTYGQTTQAQISEGNVDITAMRNALLSEADPDNPGGFRCVSAQARATGCVPVNVFGFNTISPDAIAYISADKTRNATVEQRVFQANLAGDLIDLSAGPLQVAFGVERREEESSVINDPLTVRGLNSGNAVPNVVGEFDVNEFYMEFNVPIIRDQFVDYAGFGVAARQSDYSTVGETTTYEGRFEVKVNDQWMIRASQARAVRAPNIEELFDAGTQTFAQVSDPCSGVKADTPGVIAENCRSIPDIAARIAANPEGEFKLTQSEIQGTTGFVGGNLNLFEETADTFTVGFVYTPSFLPDWMNTSLAVDYWDIEVEDAIIAISRNNVLDLCYRDANFPNNPLCNNIVRFGPENSQRGALDEVNSTEENIGSIATSGVDIDFNFNLDFGELGLPIPGDLSVSTVYTYLEEYDTVNLPGGPIDNEKGEIGNPEHSLNTTLRYVWNDLTVQWQVRYIDESRLEDSDVSEADCAGLDCTVDAVTYSDIQVRYTIADAIAGTSSLVLIGGVENAFDEDAPLIPSGLQDSDTGTETNAGVYDAIGRAWYVGFRATF